MPFPLVFMLNDIRLPSNRILEKPFLMDSDIEDCLRICREGREVEDSGV